MERVIAYIDGFNLYFGLKEKGWRRYYWVNPRALILNLLRPGQRLVQTKYFTARIATSSAVVSLTKLVAGDGPDTIQVYVTRQGDVLRLESSAPGVSVHVRPEH